MAKSANGLRLALCVLRRVLAGGRAWTMLIVMGIVLARKMLENTAESHQSSARFVGPVFTMKVLTVCLLF